MQRCDITVYIRGDQRQQVQKYDVSVAEIVVLQAEHGSDAVRDIRPRRNRTGDVHAREFDRLCQIYGETRIREAFPGLVPQLPFRLSDIGIDRLSSPLMAANAVIEDDDEPAEVQEAEKKPVKRRGRPPKARPASDAEVDAAPAEEPAREVYAKNEADQEPAVAAA